MAPRPPRRWVVPGLLGRLVLGALAAVMGAGLTGCKGVVTPQKTGQDQEIRGTVVMAMAISSDETIDGELSEALKGRLAMTLREFRLMHPQAEVQLQLFPEAQLLEETRVRSAAGLGPDLLFVGNSTATDLLRAGLTRTVRMPPAFLKRIDPDEAHWFQSPNGELTSVPVLLMPQLACFDRRRLAQPPTDLNTLMERSSQGLRVGLPLDGFNLAWTFGSVGVLRSVEALSAGQPATEARRQDLARWLQWLKTADQVQDVNFQLSQRQMIMDLAKGQARLKHELGPHLGVTTLPRGPGGPPSPVSRLKVLAFGRNSSPEQQRVAEAFARFVLTPLTQRNLAMQQQEVLPVLDAQRLTTGRKGTLRLLAIAQDQMLRAHGKRTPLFEHGDQNGMAMGLVLSRYLYGDLSTDGAVDGLVRAIQSGGSEP